MQRKLLLVEDDARLASAVVLALRAAGGGAWRVTCEGSARAGLAAAKSEPPDLAIVDLGLPDEPGTWLIGELARAESSVPSVAFTIFDDRRRVLEAVRAGAVGYVLKEEPVERLLEHIEECLAGHTPVSSRVARYLFEACRAAQPHVLDGLLTKRERDVLECLARGASYAECATTLRLGLGTIQSHVKNLYRKLDVSTKADAIKWIRQAPS